MTRIIMMAVFCFGITFGLNAQPSDFIWDTSEHGLSLPTLMGVCKAPPQGPTGPTGIQGPTGPTGTSDAAQLDHFYALTNGNVSVASDANISFPNNGATFGGTIAKTSNTVFTLLPGHYFVHVEVPVYYLESIYGNIGTAPLSQRIQFLFDNILITPASRLFGFDISGDEDISLATASFVLQQILVVPNSRPAGITLSVQNTAPNAFYIGQDLANVTVRGSIAIIRISDSTD